ncbi:Oidioi.mRNA.OKI2018_I69.chr1.g3475.t1.cds [Oikopleura dioica]|uniref:Oidioi.mRNA.OKI2018_I69.chr1.g3475.t1.cds n=1 Tax=Oikopleura dioica TaxID=34765 RepID=A0ABN7T3D9_OIKDI|nr:Oidioi.mRNA.OKI2018_I69.chr1.g3475.t1.cds [Oikopleura dioica]
MANNEAFNALQREALSQLLTSIGVKAENLSDEVDAGIKKWRLNRFGSTNPNTVKDQIESVVDKFRMHNFTAQADDFDDHLDNFIDRALVKGKSGNSDLHWEILHFLLEMSNSPTQAAEIKNPAKKANASIEEQSEESEDSENSNSEEFDNGDRWDDKLSTWSEVTKSDEGEDNEDLPEENQRSGFPEIPKKFKEFKRIDRVYNLAEEFQKVADKHPTRQVYPVGEQPWKGEKTMGKLYGEVMDHVPINGTLEYWIEQTNLLHKKGYGKGFDKTKYIVANERQCQVWLCDSCMGMTENHLVIWNEEKQQASINEFILVQHTAPEWHGYIKRLLPLITNVRKVRDFFWGLTGSTRHENKFFRPAFLDFDIQLMDLLQSRVFVFFRRWRNHAMTKHTLCSTDLLVSSAMKQIFEEGMKITEIALEVISVDRSANPCDISSRTLSILFKHLPIIHKSYESFAAEYSFLLKKCMWRYVNCIQLFASQRSFIKVVPTFPLRFTDVDKDSENFIDECVARSNNFPIPPLEPALSLLYEIMRMRAVLQNWGVEERFSDRTFMLENAFEEHWDELSDKYFGRRNVLDDAYLSTRVWVSYEEKKFTKEQLESFGPFAERMKQLNKKKVYHRPEKSTDWKAIIRKPSKGNFNFKMSRGAALNCGETNPWHKEFLKPIMAHLRSQYKCYKAQLAEIDLQRYVDAHIDFFLGDMGDHVNDIAWLLMDKSLGGKLHSSLVEEVIEQCPRFHKFEFDIKIEQSSPKSALERLHIAFKMPPMLKTIISDSCQERYLRIYRRMILMACASIGVSGRFADKKNRAREEEEYSEESSAFTEDEADEIYMQRHLQLILPTFAHAFQIAIIQPLVKQFRENAARSDTIFDLIKYHKEMVAKLETAVFFEETPVIGKKVLTILKIAKDFERNHHKRSTQEEFVKTCADLRMLTKSIHDKLVDERTRSLFQGMSEVLYYTDVRNQARNNALSAAMKFKGAHKNAQIFFPSVGTPVKKNL